MEDKKQAYKPNAHTHKVFVGNVAVGGDAPVSIQSMTNTKTTDPDATLAQIHTLADAGCEIVRVAIPHADALDGFSTIAAKSPLPVVADIHFDYRLACEAAQRGAAAIRINPGNIGDMAHVDKVIASCKAASIPIRIGVNAGSLDKDIDARQDLTIEEKLLASAVSFVEYFRKKGFDDIVLSAKAHDVQTTIACARRLSEALPEIPLHLGVTEAGTPLQATVKNAMALGNLLMDGIGNTLRVSITGDPVQEIEAGWAIVSAAGVRRRGPELISCPTCGRCEVNLIPIAQEIEKRLKDIHAPISVAVMGCVVNGPGEASGADIGVACGKGQGLLFANGKSIGKVSEDRIVDALMEEIHARFENKIHGI